MIYYSYTATEQQKQEIQLASVCLELYMLRQSWCEGMPSKSLKDYLVKPAGKHKRNKSQSEQGMFASLAHLANISEESFNVGFQSKSSGGSDSSGI